MSHSWVIFAVFMQFLGNDNSAFIKVVSRQRRRSIQNSQIAVLKDIRSLALAIQKLAFVKITLSKNLLAKILYFLYLAFIDDSREPKAGLFIVWLVVDFDRIAIGEDWFSSLSDSLANACYWEGVSGPVKLLSKRKRYR